MTSYEGLLRPQEENELYAEAYVIGDTTTAERMDHLLYEGFSDREAFDLALICHELGDSLGECFFEAVIAANRTAQTPALIAGEQTLD